MPVEPMPPRGLSVVIPVYNERETLGGLLIAVAQALPGISKELVIVDDCSTDGTRDWLKRNLPEDRAEAASLSLSASGDLDFVPGPGLSLRVIYHQRNLGKGGAVRSGFAAISGEIAVIQDADLEYDIDDYDILLDPLYRNRAAFVLGVRHGRHGDSWKMRHFEDQFAVSQVMNLGHLFFTGLFNVVYGQRMSDPFTMFKVFRRDCIDGVAFECNRFDFDWELVAKLVRRGYAPVEIPVNYASRSFTEGKKVAFFRDPLTWIRACIKYRFVKV